MKLLVLSRADVERALDPDALVDALAQAFARLSEGAVSMPPRAAVETPRGVMMLMGAHVRGAEALSVKLVGVYPHNPSGGAPAHQAVIAVFDADTGTPRALMDGELVTTLRTAAVSLLATRLLA